MDQSTVTSVESLARRMQQWDRNAYQEFSDTFTPQFRGLFLRSGLSPTEAEDLAVTCVSEISLKIDEYKPVPEGSFIAWVFTVARNLLTDWWRDQQTELPLWEHVFVAPLWPSSHSPNRTVIAAVREAVTQLNPNDQEILYLRDLGPFHSYQEISSKLSIRENTARVRHHRAIQKLRAILEQDPRIQAHLQRFGWMHANTPTAQMNA